MECVIKLIYRETIHICEARKPCICYLYIRINWKAERNIITHKGLSNLVEAQRLAFNIRSDSKILQFSPFSFDASVWETFMALANGATLCLLRQEYISSGPELVRVINKLKVTNITMPPSV